MLWCDMCDFLLDNNCLSFFDAIQLIDQILDLHSMLCLQLNQTPWLS